MKAESILIDNIKAAFSHLCVLEDEWIISNPYIFEEVDTRRAKTYLPDYMIYVLKEFRENPRSMVYIQLLSALNEYSKCKDSEHPMGLWFLLSGKQRRAVLNFLGHLLHNQKGCVDQDDIQKIMQRWKNVI